MRNDVVQFYRNVDLDDLNEPDEEAPKSPEKSLKGNQVNLAYESPCENESDDL